MFSYLVWWIGIGLECVLLLRGPVTGLWRKYPLFYCYIGCVLLKDLTALVTYLFIPTAYAFVYWPAELVTVLASFAVLIEIFRGAVRHNPGMVRFVQNFLLFTFSVTFFYVCLTFSYRGLTSVYRGIEQLGRDLRLVEGSLLIALLWLFVRYRIALSRNLLGVVIGYSFWIGINLMDFAFLPTPGADTSQFLRVVVPTSYTLTLGVWCFALWFRLPQPVQRLDQLEHDYDFFALKTRQLIARTSDSLARALKP